MTCKSSRFRATAWAVACRRSHAIVRRLQFGTPAPRSEADCRYHRLSVHSLGRRAQGVQPVSLHRRQSFCTATVSTVRQPFRGHSDSPKGAADGQSCSASSKDPCTKAAASGEHVHRSAGSKDRPPSDDETKPSIDRQLVKDVSILSGSQLMQNIGFSQMVPILPLFAAQMGGHLGATGVGMVISAPAFAMLFLNVPLGRICDIIGRKPLMYCGAAMTACGAFMTGFTESLYTLLPCRLLVGAGISASSTGSSAYMADLTDRAPQHRAKIMGVNQAIGGSVWLVGPAIGGWLAETYGYRNSFLIAGGGAALCSIGYTCLQETLPAKPPAPAGKKKLGFSANFAAEVSAWKDDIMPLIRSDNQQALVALSAVPSFRWSCFSTVVTLHAATAIGAGPQDIGLMFSALAVAQGAAMPIGSYFADKSPGAKLEIVVPMGLISCASFASVTMATSLEHFLIAMAIQGCCAGFTLPSQGAFRAMITPQDKRGQAMSLERQLGSIIGLMGPVCMGMLSDLTTAPTAILFTSVLMAACHGIYFYKSSTVF